MTIRKNLRGAAIALAVGLAFVVSGCSGTAEDSGTASTAGGAASDSSESSDFSAESDASFDSDSGEGSGEGSGEAADQRAAPAVDVAKLAQSQQIRTAQVTVQVKRIDESSARVRGIATGLGGLVQEENSDFGRTLLPGEEGSSVITVRVPVDRLDTAISQLDDVGRRLDLRTSSQDVTTSIADLDSRVTSQQKSVERMRALLAEAGSVKDVIAIESELSTREADLESLQAQAAAVKDKAALSTLVVTLEMPETEPEDAEGEDGFLAGLSTGWDALKATTVAVVTVLGVLLPLSVAVAVVAVPVWFVYRRIRPATPSASPSTP